MAVESVEVVLIFFFSFIICAFVILLISGQVDQITKGLNKVEDEVAKNNFLICYTSIYFLNNSSIHCTISKNFEISVEASKNHVLMRGLESTRSLSLPISAIGYGSREVELYNFNNTIYII